MVEVEYKINNDRLINKAYFDSLLIFTTELNKQFNEELYENAYDILMNFIINDSDLDRNLKYKLRNRTKGTVFYKYIFEVFNVYQRAKTMLASALVYIEEAKTKYDIKPDSISSPNERYLNTVLYYASMNLECCTTYTHSFFDKMGQYLNYYLHLKLSEGNLYFKTVIQEIRKTELLLKLKELKLKTENLEKILETTEINIDGIEIFNESYKMRKQNIHRISVLSEGNIFSPSGILKYKDIVEKNFVLATEAYNSLNGFVKDSGYEISKIYE